MDSIGGAGHIPERHEHGSEKTAMLDRFAKEGIALQTVGTHGLAELMRRIEQKLPLNLTPEQIHSFIELGCLLERQARAEDRNRYLQRHLGQ